MIIYNKKTPFITVILPVYNGSRYLEDSIKSILSQKYETFELIIIDDASTDDSSLIIRKFISDSRVVYLSNQSNRGLFFTINRAIENSKGNLIKLWAQDDIMKSYCLGHFFKVFELVDDFSFSWCLSTRISSNDRYLDLEEEIIIEDANHAVCDFEIWDMSKVLRHFWFFGNLHGNISNVGFDKKLWEKLGGFNEKMIYSGDIDFAMRSLSFGLPICIPIELIWLRDHDGQLSKNTSKLIFELRESTIVFKELEKITLRTQNLSLINFGKKCQMDRLYPYYTSNAMKVFRMRCGEGLKMLNIISVNHSVFIILMNWIRVKLYRMLKLESRLVKLTDYPFDF